MALPRWVEPQLAKLVEKAPTGPRWVHEIKFDGFRMAAWIERGKVQLLTRSGLDWTAKYPATAVLLQR
jgi:bifunctional non-homologous end joining protein LigD